MKKILLTILIMAGSCQGVYYSKPETIEVLDYEVKEKKEFTNKSIINNLKRYKSIKINSIRKDNTEYIVNANFNGNFQDLKCFIDEEKYQYNNFSYEFNNFNKDYNGISGNIIITIS